MKITAKVTVSLKDGVLDPQGATIGEALKNLGFDTVIKVRTGKVFNIEIEAETEDDAQKDIENAAQKLLANPVIEKYKIEIIR